MASVDSLIGQLMVDDGVWMVTVLNGWINDVEPHGFITVNLLIDCHNETTGMTVRSEVATDMTGSFYRDVTDDDLRHRVRGNVVQSVWELTDDVACNEVLKAVELSERKDSWSGAAFVIQHSGQCISHAAA